MYLCIYLSIYIYIFYIYFIDFYVILIKNVKKWKKCVCVCVSVGGHRRFSWMIFFANYCKRVIINVTSIKTLALFISFIYRSSFLFEYICRNVIQLVADILYHMNTCLKIIIQHILDNPFKHTRRKKQKSKYNLHVKLLIRSHVRTKDHKP